MVKPFTTAATLFPLPSVSNDSATSLDCISNSSMQVLDCPDSRPFVLLASSLQLLFTSSELQVQYTWKLPNSSNISMFLSSVILLTMSSINFKVSRTTRNRCSIACQMEDFVYIFNICSILFICT